MSEAKIANLFSEAEVRSRVDDMAAAIATELPQRFTLVGLLKGSFVFVADLSRALSKAGCNPQIEFMRVSSYGSGTASSGIVSLMGDAPVGVKGEPVLLVDDIQDSGRTLAFTRAFLLERGAAKVWTCTLLDKPSRREVEAGEVDFIGFVIPDVFVVGYGIDYAERFRELPFIGKVEE
jgi:hypoxanthine phosphoribosyltransferase